MTLELILITLILIVFPFGQLTRLNLNYPSINLYFHDVIIILLIALWLGKKIYYKNKFNSAILMRPILGFSLIALLSWVLALNHLIKYEALVSLGYLVRFILYTGIYFVLADAVKHNKLQDKISNYLIAAGATTAVLGLLQYIFMPDLKPLESLGWDPHYFRVVGTFLDPGFIGLILVLSLILLVLKFWDKWKTNIISIIIFLIIYISLALTYSRSSYLAYLGSFGLIAYFKKNLKFFWFVLLLAIITIILLPKPYGEGVKLERESTIISRLHNWENSLKIGFDNPVLGVGFNTYRFSLKQYGFINDKNWQTNHGASGADSSLFFVFSTTGIVGLISYLIILITIIKFSLINKNPIVFCTITAIIIHSFFNNSLFYAWIMIWMWIILGMEETSFRT